MITPEELEEAPSISDSDVFRETDCIAQQRESKKRLRNRIRKSKKR